MAHEIGPPHNRAILLFTVLAVVTLVGLHFVFTSYFHAMVGAELSEKVDTVPPREYNRLVREQQIQLSQGPLPLEQAINQLTSAGRRGVPFVRPEPSEDLQALAGWMHHPSYKPPAEPAAPPKEEPDATPSSEASPVAPVNGDEAPAGPAGEEAGATAGSATGADAGSHRPPGSPRAAAPEGERRAPSVIAQTSAQP